MHLKSHFPASKLGPPSWRTRQLTKKVPVATGTSQANTGTFDYQAFGNIFRSTLGAFYVNLYAGQYGYLFFNAAAVPMYYTQARWYDPTTGTWLSRDPIGFDGEDWNLYRYVGNEPVGRVDPGGRIVEIPIILCIGACGGTLGCTMEVLLACAHCGKDISCWNSCRPMLSKANRNLCRVCIVACGICFIGAAVILSPKPE